MCLAPSNKNEREKGFMTGGSRNNVRILVEKFMDHPCSASYFRKTIGRRVQLLELLVIPPKISRIALQICTAAALLWAHTKNASSCLEIHLT
jgi:hypothetical protein